MNTPLSGSPPKFSPPKFNPPKFNPRLHHEAADAIRHYAAAIADLELAAQPLSETQVQAAFFGRDAAYQKVYALCGIWIADIVFNLLKVLVQILLAILNHLPRWLYLPVTGLLRSLGLAWFGLPKDLRLWLVRGLHLPGLHQVKIFFNHLVMLKRLHDLDARLYVQAERINQEVAPIAPAVWEQLEYPPVGDPFGFILAPRKTPWRDRLDVVWEFLSILCLTATFAILVNISGRLFSGGADAKGIQEIILPSLLTLLAGSGLTRTGREALGRIFDGLNAPKYWRDEFIFISIFLVFLGVCNLWRQLPEMAVAQTRTGHESMCFIQPAAPAGLPWFAPPPSPEPNSCVPQLTKAETSYRLAIKLDPDNTDAHYGLGRVYEALQQGDAAISHYQLAVKGELQGLSYRAYDRLSRLFILNGKKDSKDDGYSKAIVIGKNGLDRLSTLKPNQQTQIGSEWLPEMKYALQTNLGWAYLLGQDNLGDAASYLEQAKGLIKNRARAYCLLAQVYDKQNQASRAKATWEECIAFANGPQQNSLDNDPEEESWLNQGRRRLNQLAYEETIQKAQLQLGNNRLDEAYRLLQSAIAQNRSKATAYCLMAQVDEKRQKLQVAKTHWELCANFARLDSHDREIWLNQARDRLSALMTVPSSAPPKSLKGNPL